MGGHTEKSTGIVLYQTTLFTSLLEYFVILFFGTWLIVEYSYNVYEQQYFGSFNPVFLVAILMAISGYGFARLVSTHRTGLRGPRPEKVEDDY